VGNINGLLIIQTYQHQQTFRSNMWVVRGWIRDHLV